MNDFSLAMSFDDVLLVPRKSNVTSRSNIDISSSIMNEEFSLPFISSPMDTITGQNMAKTMCKQGGFGIIHRYNSIREQVSSVETALSSGAERVAAAVGDAASVEDPRLRAYFRPSD